MYVKNGIKIVVKVRLRFLTTDFTDFADYLLRADIAIPQILFRLLRF